MYTAGQTCSLAMLYESGIKHAGILGLPRFLHNSTQCLSSQATRAWSWLWSLIFLILIRYDPDGIRTLVCTILAPCTQPKGLGRTYSSLCSADIARQAGGKSETRKKPRPVAPPEADFFRFSDFSFWNALILVAKNATIRNVKIASGGMWHYNLYLHIIILLV